jgi:hypothetical protein
MTLEAPRFGQPRQNILLRCRSVLSLVGEKGLAHAGELIPIIAEAAPRLIAAVEELRRQAEPEGDKREDENLDRAIENVDRQLSAVVTEIVRLKGRPLDAARRAQLYGRLIVQWERLNRVQQSRCA